MLDDEARYMLGLPLMADLAEELFSAIKAAAELGFTARQMHRQRPDVELHEWMFAGALLRAKRRVVTEYRPVKQPDSAAQETVYYVAS